MKTTKSLARDVAVLNAVLRNIDKLILALNRFDCNNRHKLMMDNQTFDLCSFYIAQIGESMNRLTDSSKKSLQMLSLKKLYITRNIIDHDYESVNKEIVLDSIFMMVDRRTIEIIRNRILYCKNNKQK